MMRLFKRILKWIGYLLLTVIFIFTLFVVIPEKETVKPIKPRKDTRYWAMSGGFNIAYTHLKSTADSIKSPIIFCHGGPGGYIHSSIIHTLDEMTNLGHDVYLYDQRGSGLSDRLEKYSDISFDAHIKDLDEIISQKIKRKKVILMGQSFGSELIAHYSAYYPDAIEKMIFSSPGGLTPHRMKNEQYVDLDSLFRIPDSLKFIEPYSFVKDVDRVARKPKAITLITGAMLLDKKLISDKQADRILNTLASKFTRGMVCDEKNVLPEEGGGGLYAFIATNQGDIPDVRDKIRQLEIPIIVIQGQCDYIPFSLAYEYVDLYKNSAYKFIENAGHEIWWEQKERYLQVISHFLSD